MKKKIIIVSTALWIGGIETALVNLLHEIDYEQYEVTCLIIRADLDLVDQIDSRCKLLIADRNGVYSFEEKYRYKKLYHLTEKSDHPSKLHKMLMWTTPFVRWLENRLYIRYIKEQLAQEHYDTAIIYSDVVAELTVRAIDADKYLMFYHHGAMRHVYHDQIAYKKCSNIIAVSDNLAEELKSFVPEVKEKIISFHNFVDYKGVRDKSKLPIEHTFEEDKIHLVTVGRLAPEKGIDIAIEACNELVLRGVTNFKWWIVGGGPEYINLQSLIKECQLEPYIEMVGMKTNPYPYIQKADIYVQPGRVEAFGLTIKEAMILGKTIISTATAGASEILINGENGLLCDITKDAIADQVIRAIEDEDIRKSIESNLKSIQWEKENKELSRKICTIL